MLEVLLKPSLCLLAGFAVGFTMYEAVTAPIEVQFALAVFALGFGPFWLIAGWWIYDRRRLKNNIHRELK